MVSLSVMRRLAASLGLDLGERNRASWRAGRIAVTDSSNGGSAVAVHTFIAYVGVYDSVADAEADYDLVKDLHTKANLVDAYDAAMGS
jgi:hypothetical protein